jgi:hypothetical protein
MDDLAGLEPSASAVEFVGPFEHHEVVINGWRVPFLEAHPQRAGKILVVLDDRGGLELSVDEAQRVLPFIADAIAVASGYSCHPRSESEAPLSLPHTRPRRTVSLDWARAEEGEAS